VQQSEDNNTRNAFDNYPCVKSISGVPFQKNRAPLVDEKEEREQESERIVDRVSNDQGKVGLLA
jgi:hypothetical protein